MLLMKSKDEIVCSILDVILIIPKIETLVAFIYVLLLLKMQSLIWSFIFPETFNVTLMKKVIF